jgi:vacuolar-type H+-ATPase subunit H
MEEIAGSDAIRREVLEDARKKAAKLLAEADEAAAMAIAEAEARARSSVGEIARTGEARAERFRAETLARLPLELRRIRTVFVDARLREAMGWFLDGLAEDRVAALAEAMLARGESFFSGQTVVVARRGISEAAARACAARALGSAAATKFAVDESLPARGLTAAVEDGRVGIRATMDLVGDELLDRDRGELARALCPEAMEGQA